MKKFVILSLFSLLVLMLALSSCKKGFGPGETDDPGNEYSSPNSEGLGELTGTPNFEID